MERKENVTSSDCAAMLHAVQEQQEFVMALAKNIHDELAGDETIMAMYSDMDEMAVMPDVPSMLTISVDIDSDENVAMEWQSGDNSYSGACYSHRFWAVVYFDTTATPESYYEQLLEDMNNNLPW